MSLSPPESSQAGDHHGVSGSPLTLCLSGGGFRATLFHLGVLRRLNELGVLATIGVVSSVSGGSILNGVLASRWQTLEPDSSGVFANCDERIGNSVREFCGHDLRTKLLIGARMNPRNWLMLIRNYGAVAGNLLATGYQELLGGVKLVDLPDSARGRAPRFIFCATNIQTGACWGFHSGPGAKMGDFYSGYTPCGAVTLADAVAASSAFPPGFGALSIEAPASAFDRTDPWGQKRPLSKKRPPLSVGMHWLSDGGVYDNLGVEPVWETAGVLIVSDAGHPFASTRDVRQWIVSRLARAVEISTAQVGALRRRWLVDQFRRGQRLGVLWTMGTPIEDFPGVCVTGYGYPKRLLFEEIRTDLNGFSEGEIACLENHGYSLADAAIRSRLHHLSGASSVPFRWPHQAFGNDCAIKRELKDSGRRSLFRDAYEYLTGERAR